jgi:transposase
LTKEQQSCLKQDILTPPRNLGYKFSNWTGKTVAQHILQKFNKKMTSRGAIALLHRMNLKLLSPRPTPAKADEIKKQEFKVSLGRTIEKMTPQDHMFFFDAATVQYSATKTRKWAEKGHQPIIPTIGGRQKMHLIGAIEPAGDRGWFAECPTLGAKGLIGFLLGLLRRYPDGDLYVILDNAKAHHAKRVTAFLLRNSRLHLLYLPPYSPDLNPIEDFWRILRRNVTHNTYYATFEAFRSAVIEYLTRFKISTGAITSLGTRYENLIKKRALEIKA